MFLVGGFAESGILQQEIRKEFGDVIQIRIPQDTSLAILKGDDSPLLSSTSSCLVTS